MHNLSTILDYIRYFTSQLKSASLYFGHGTDNALDEACALVLGQLDLPFDLSSDYFHARLTQNEQLRLQHALKLRIEQRIPVAYINKRAFYGGIDFYVDKRVLIPRSPIIELLENYQSWWGDKDVTAILDLCCGSGCLGLLAKLQQPQASLILSDIDSDALEVAAINVKRLQQQDISIIRSDVFAQITGTFDWIICNPPYVEEQQRAELAAEYAHEPPQALYSGVDGMTIVRRVLAAALKYLNTNGVLILEVGANAALLEAAFPEIDFTWIDLQRGGDGVCIIAEDELWAWQKSGFLDGAKN